MNKEVILQDRQGEETQITLNQEISSGGEGSIFTLKDKSDLVVKLFKEPVKRRQKIEAMLDIQVIDPLKSSNHIGIVWPTHLVFKNGDFAGYAMPYIRDSSELTNFVIPLKREKIFEESNVAINWRDLHVIAYNLARVVAALHEVNCILADLKPQNILVNYNSLISIVDTDSFQIQTSQNIFPCLVWTEEYMAPELFGKRGKEKQIALNVEHDNFSLAIIIYYILTGEHPHSAGRIRQGRSLSQNTNAAGIEKWTWMYREDSPREPSESSIDKEMLHPEVAILFDRAFNDGHNEPRARPTAREWERILNKAIDSLVECKKKPNNHIYVKGRQQCPWCLRSQQISVDIFYYENIQKRIANPQVNSPILSKAAPQPRIANPQVNRPISSKVAPQSTPYFPPKFFNAITGTVLVAACIILFVVVTAMYQSFNQNNNKIVELTSSKSIEIKNNLVESILNGKSSYISNETQYNYKPLYTALKNKSWKAADRITYNYIYKMSGYKYRTQEWRFIPFNPNRDDVFKEKLGKIMEGNLYSDQDDGLHWGNELKMVRQPQFKIEDLPCQDLLIINTLWSKYSKGKYGYAKQLNYLESIKFKFRNRKEVFQFQNRGEIFRKFSSSVGWANPFIERYGKAKYEELEFANYFKSKSIPTGYYPRLNTIRVREYNYWQARGRGKLYGLNEPEDLDEIIGILERFKVCSS
jgi:serine/threonine protein kinase